MLGDYIRSNFDFRETQNGEELRINCPFCLDTKYHGYVNTWNKVYHCFKCDKGAHAWGLLVYGFRMAPSDAKDILYGDSEGLGRYYAVDRIDIFLSEMDRLRYGDADPLPEEETLVRMPESYDMESHSLSKIGTKAWQYLEKRLGKRTKSYSRLLKFRFCMRGPYEGRIILPVWNRGSLVYFQARSFNPPNRQPTYLNPNVERPLFFPFLPEKTVILCEGYFDALAIGKGAAATFGSELTNKQIKQLLSLDPEHIIVSFDPDEAGIRGTIKTCNRLRAYTRVSAILPRLSADPGDLGEGVWEEMKKYIRPWGPNTDLVWPE